MTRKPAVWSALRPLTKQPRRKPLTPAEIAAIITAVSALVTALAELLKALNERPLAHGCPEASPETQEANVAQESIEGWGGARENSGRPTGVSSGTGTKLKVTVSVGSDLLDALRTHRPDLAGLSDQDLLRAALWIAIGQDLPS